MKIVLTTGGSGGHIFPALDVACELNKKSHEVMFIGSFKGQESSIKDRGFNCQSIESRGFHGRNPIKILGSLRSLIVSFFVSRHMLKMFRPDVVIGFGSHSSAAVILAAYTMRIPAMIHEQNVYPGKANRCLAKFVKKIAISFGSSKEYFNPDKVTLTGCPTPIKQGNKDSYQIYAQWCFDPTKKTVLVFGGSQGAHQINKAFLESLDLFNTKINFQIIHICGGDDLRAVEEAYAKREVQAKVFSFLDVMADAYQISDLVISRAGALTVTELMIFQKKALLIPYPYAGAHQLENAKILERQHLAKIIDQEMLTPKILKNEIEDALKQKDKAQSEDLKQEIAFLQESSKRVADLALSLV